MPQPFNPASIDAFASVIQGMIVRRPTAIVPATGTSQSLFQNSGAVMLTGVWGVVTAAADANAELLRLFLGASGTTDISGLTTTIAVAVKGAIITCTGVLATVPVITVPTVPTTHATFRGTNFINGILWPYVSTGPLALGVAGTVATNLTCSIQWNCSYVPMEAGATVQAV
jgi:hypothetical protein